MSYARWSDSSSVYVFGHVDGGVMCCGCTFFAYSFEQLAEHLREHQDAGDTVPGYLLERDTYDPADFVRPDAI